jgi:hypothetical protein
VIFITPMFAAAFTIRFVMPVDGTSIDKVRNFGEELMRTMRDQELGDVSDPDTAIDELSISLRSRRHLGQVRKLIRKLLVQHYLDADAVVTEVSISRQKDRAE